MTSDPLLTSVDGPGVSNLRPGIGFLISSPLSGAGGNGATNGLQAPKAAVVGAFHLAGEESPITGLFRPH